MTYHIKITDAFICQGSLTLSAVNSAVDFNGYIPVFKFQLKCCGEQNQSFLHATALKPDLVSNIFFFFTAVTRPHLFCDFRLIIWQAGRLTLMSQRAGQEVERYFKPALLVPFFL